MFVGTCHPHGLFGYPTCLVSNVRMTPGVSAVPICGVTDTAGISVAVSTPIKVAQVVFSVVAGLDTGFRFLLRAPHGVEP